MMQIDRYILEWWKWNILNTGNTKIFSIDCILNRFLFRLIGSFYQEQKRKTMMNRKYWQEGKCSFSHQWHVFRVHRRVQETYSKLANNKQTNTGNRKSFCIKRNTMKKKWKRRVKSHQQATRKSLFWIHNFSPRDEGGKKRRKVSNTLSRNAKPFTVVPCEIMNKMQNIFFTFFFLAMVARTLCQFLTCSQRSFLNKNLIPEKKSLKSILDQ